MLNFSSKLNSHTIFGVWFMKLLTPGDGYT